MWIFTGSGLRSHSKTLVAKPVCKSNMSPGSTTTPSAVMISCECLEVDPAPFVPEMVSQVDQHPPPLDSVERHVLEPEVMGERPMAAAIAAGVGPSGPTRSTPAR